VFLISAFANEALVDLEPPRLGAIDDRPQPTHLAFVAILLGGTQTRQRVEVLLVESNLLSTDLLAM
jgi:hypothetical protein